MDHPNSPGWNRARWDETPPAGYVAAAQKDLGLVWMLESEVVTYECGCGYCWRPVEK